MSFTKQSAKVMRAFHNRVKLDLIAYAKSQCGFADPSVVVLLDVGVGRGGDMFKWDKCNIQHVIGYDPDETYVNEALRRFNHSSLNGVRDYSFIHSHDIEQLNVHDNSIDIVSCQFALHYFFKSYDMLYKFLFNISRILKWNGMFIGTIMDGDVLINKTRNGSMDYYNSAVLIHLSESPDSTTIGRPVNVHLTGTLYFGEDSVSHEYIVQKHVLESVCRTVGLSLIEYKSFEQHHLQQTSEFRMHDDCKDCSYMYTSFIFKKIC